MNKVNTGFRGSDFIILTAIVLLIIGTAFTLGCLDDDGPDSDHDGIADTDDLCDDEGVCANIAGDWRLGVSNITSTNCVDRNDWGSDIVIDQNGCTLFITGIKGSGQTVGGCVTGDTVTIGPGDFNEDEGTTTLTLDLDLVSGDLIGQGWWEWVSDLDAGDTCDDGTADVVATRVSLSVDISPGGGPMGNICPEKNLYVAIITGGDPPYSYSWVVTHTDGAGFNIISWNNELQSFEVCPWDSMTQGTIEVTVTDSANQIAVDSISVSAF